MGIQHTAHGGHSMRRAALMAAAVAFPSAVIVALALAPDDSSGDGSVHASPPPAEAACSALIDSLPETVLGLAARDVTPANEQVRAWGDPAIVLRCGVQRPAGLVPASDATVIYSKNEGQGDAASVLWLPDPGAQDAKSPVVFTAVDRDVYVELQVPFGQTVMPLPLVSDWVAAAFPNQICLGQTLGGGALIPDDQLCTHRP